MEDGLRIKLKKNTVNRLNSGLSLRLVVAGITLIVGLILYNDFQLTLKEYNMCGNEYIPDKLVFICIGAIIVINLLYVLWLRTTFGRMELVTDDEV